MEATTVVLPSEAELRTMLQDCDQYYLEKSQLCEKLANKKLRPDGIINAMRNATYDANERSTNPLFAGFLFEDAVVYPILGKLLRSHEDVIRSYYPDFVNELQSEN